MRHSLRGAAVVVDKWELVRVGIGSVLSQCGMSVGGAAGGVWEGVYQARATGASLIVFGSHLDMSPLQAVRLAKRDDPPLTVVALLEPLGDRDLMQVLRAGADAALLQSAGRDDLGDAIAKVLAGERVIHPALLATVAGALASAGTPAPDDSRLTRKEREVINLLAQGSTNREIAATMFVSEATVKTHLSNIYAKLGVNGRQEAVSKAVALRLIG